MWLRIKKFWTQWGNNAPEKSRWERERMYDIVKKYKKVSPETLKRYEVMDESASINECLKINGAVNHDFRPVWPGTRLVGTALTVQVRPGDNLILHKAVSMVQPGDVLVVSCDGYLESGGMWGGIMSLGAKSNGAVGMIIDGAVRDTMLMKEIGFWVWSRGINIKGSTKVTPGKINNPIMIGNVRVNPGDLVFADNDSVVFVPCDLAESTLEIALKREEDEAKVSELTKKDGSWVYNNKFKAKFEALGLSEEPD